MEEIKVKKNIDYSASAVNLGDYEPVKVALNVYKGLETKAAVCRLKLEETPEWIELEKISNQLNELKQEVKEAIDECGSYQDVENGWYAVKQRKESKSYLPEPFAKNFEKYAPAVIVETINVKALEGLIKGKLITEEELDKAGVIQRAESFAYIIK